MATLAEKMKKALQGVKVVDKIDLEKIPETARPVTPTREEKRENRKYMTRLRELRDKAHNIELVIADLKKQYDEDDVIAKAQQRKQKQLRKDFLEQRMKVRKQYDNFELSHSERQRIFHLQGIRPQPMDVVHFHVLRSDKSEPYDGVALVRDENHYYVAADLYPQTNHPDNLTTCMSENPDNTFEGIWPRDTCLSKPSIFEERTMRHLVDKYADDIERAKAFVEGAQQRDIDEIAQLSSEIDALTQSLDSYATIDKQLADKRSRLGFLNTEIKNLMESHKTEKQPVQDTPKDETKKREILVRRLTPPDLTASEQRYPHLAYVRMKRELQDMSYPFIDLELKSWLRFRLMANIARLIGSVAKQRSLTYVLSKEYFEELSHRASTAYRGMSVDSVVPVNERASGVIVFPHQGFEDTIIYDFNHKNNLMLCVAYIREGRLMFYESYTNVQIVGVPRIDNFMCHSMREEGADLAHVFNFIRNLVVSFLAMECDMQRTMKHFIEDGQAEEVVRDMPDEYNTDNDEDLVIRDSNWYFSISVDHLIPVQGYVSHRWCGKGKDKVLQEVWVRPTSATATTAKPE